MVFKSRIGSFFGSAVKIKVNCVPDLLNCAHDLLFFIACHVWGSVVANTLGLTVSTECNNININVIYNYKI